MSTLRKPVVAVCAVAASMLWVSASFAQEAPPAPADAPAAAPAPAPGTTASTTTTTTQPVTLPPPPIQTTQQPAAQQTTSSTTTTTAAPYGYTPTGGDRFTERTIDRRPNRALLSTGTGLFILSYGGSVIAGAVSDRDEDKRLFIPLVGPWLDLGQRSCNAATPCGSNEDVAKAMIVTSGVVQGAGVLMALGSLLIPESTTVSEKTQTTAKPTVKVLPVSFSAGAGVGAVGRF